MQTLMVCSAVSGEGKTTVTFNLAKSLARLQRKVLLIDCDMRNPALYKMLRVDECSGLMELTRGEATPDSVIHTIDGEGIDVIFAGLNADDASEMLSTSSFMKAIEKYKTTYDYILMDTPPTSILSDAEELADCTDGALMVIRQNYASRAGVVDGLARIADSGVQIIGYVLNMYTGGASVHYGYGYGYG